MLKNQPEAPYIEVAIILAREQYVSKSRPVSNLIIHIGLPKMSFVCAAPLAGNSYVLIYLL